MAGTPLTEFTDFANMTPPLYITSAEDFVNDAIVQAPLFGRLMVGRDMSEVLQGGTQIRDTIKLSVTSTGKHYHPGASVGGYTNRQSSSLHSLEWRYFRDYMTWVDKEIEQNVPEGLSPGARHALYKRLFTSKEQDFWTSVFNSLDAALLANPGGNVTSMEDASGTEPIPLYAWINEETDRVASGWTTVGGIDATTNPNWQNELRQYDFAQPDDEDGDNDGLLDAFEAMYLQLQFKPPNIVPGTERFFQRSGQDPRKMFIGTSNTGLQFYKRRLLERNDRTFGAQDPAYPGPTYAGIPVEQISSLGTMAVYAGDSSTFVSETAATVTTTGYRYYFVDGNFLVPIIHVRKFFQKQPSFVLQDQPDTTVQLVGLWWNLFCRSRKRLGIVSPGA